MYKFYYTYKLWKMELRLKIAYLWQRYFDNAYLYYISLPENDFDAIMILDKVSEKNGFKVCYEYNYYYRKFLRYRIKYGFIKKIGR